MHDGDNGSMRHRIPYMIFIIIILFWTASCGAKEGHHLFILSGQSNMTKLDPAVSFLPAVVDEFGREIVIVIKHARDGQPIRRWYKNWRSATGKTLAPSGDIYDQLLRKVRNATAGIQLATITFIWMQGEMDAKLQYGDVYQQSLLGLVEQFQHDLQRTDINVVIGRLSDYDLDDAVFPHWTKVRSAQARAANGKPFWSWVDTDGLNDGLSHGGTMLEDDLHYSRKGYKILGRRFAREAISMIQKRLHQDNGK